MVTQKLIEKIYSMYADGYSVREISNALHASDAAVSRILQSPAHPVLRDKPEPPEFSDVALFE